MLKSTTNSSIKHLTSKKNEEEEKADEEPNDISSVSKRISRYEKHCDSKQQPTIHSESVPNVHEGSNGSRSPSRKMDNLGLMLKNSLSSTSRESSPTILKLSRSATPTPLLQSVSIKREDSNQLKLPNNLNKIKKSNSSSSSSSSRSYQKHSTSKSAMSNKFILVETTIADAASTQSANNLNVENANVNLTPKSAIRKTVAFQDDSQNRSTKRVNILRKFSLNASLTANNQMESENDKHGNQTENRVRRKSLSNFVLADERTFSVRTNESLLNRVASNSAELRRESLENKKSQFLSEHLLNEPEPDYWIESMEKPNGKKSNFNDNDLSKTSQIVQRPLSLTNIQTTEAVGSTNIYQEEKEAIRTLNKVLNRNISISSSSTSSNGSLPKVVLVESSEVTSQNVKIETVKRDIEAAQENTKPSNHTFESEEVIIEESYQVIGKQHDNYRKILQSQSGNMSINEDYQYTNSNNVTKHNYNNNFLNYTNNTESLISNVYSNNIPHKDLKFYKMESKTGQFITSVQITGITINDDEELPQPPTQSYLKLTNMEENANGTSGDNAPSRFDPSPVPPPPPPPPPPLPNSLFSNNPLASKSKQLNEEPIVHNNLPSRTVSNRASLMATVMNLNTESLLMARKNLKSTAESNGNQQSGNPEIKSKQDTTTDSTAFNKITKQESNVGTSQNTQNLRKKTELLLLQEMQNHRLYNTKKDYLLNYLERNTTSATSNVIASSSQNAVDSAVVGEASDNAKTSNNLNRTLSFAERTVSGTESPSSKPSDETPKERQDQETTNKVANYERFPYLRYRSSNQATNVNSKYANANFKNGYPMMTKRAQSSGACTTARTPLKTETQVDKATNQISNSKVNGAAVIIIENRSEKSTNKNEIRSSSVVRKVTSFNGNNPSISNQESDLANTNQVKMFASSSSSAAVTAESSFSTSSMDLNNSTDANYRRFRLIQPAEKIESELVQVFKVSKSNF